MSETTQTRTTDQSFVDLVMQAGNAFEDVAGVARFRKAVDSQIVPINSMKFRAYLSELYFGANAELAPKSIISDIVLYLEGYAQKHGPPVRTLDEVADSDPVLALIISMVNKKGRMSVTASKLLGKLTKRTKRKPYLRLPSWPKSPEAMGKRVRKLKPWLVEAGIEVIEQRSGSQRLLLFRKMTAVTVQ